MDHRVRRLSAAALAVVIVLTVTPSATARPREGDFALRAAERIVSLVANIKTFFGIGTNEDAPLPPRP